MRGIIFLIIFSFNITKIGAQCAANYTYSVGAGGNVTFSNTSTFTGTMVTYTWDFGDMSPISNLVNPSHTYSNNGIYNVTLYIYDSIPNNSCFNIITQTLTINTSSCLLSANVSTFQSSGGTVFFNDMSTGINSNTTYTLDFGDNTSSNMISSHTYTAAGLYTITLIAENTPSCTSTYTNVINVSVVNCNLNPNFTYSVNGGVVNFLSTSTGTSPTTQYYWYFENGNQSNAQNPPPQTFLYNGNYTVTLQIQDSVLFNCSNYITQTITITNAPCYVNSSFTLSKDSTALPAIVWNAYPSYPINVVSAIWNWGDNSSTAALYPSHTYSAAGVYSICLTVSVSCGQSSTTCMSSNIFKSSESMVMATINVINVAAGIKDNSELDSKTIIIYPNPNKGEFNIRTNGELIESVKIYNSLGKEVYFKNNIYGSEYLINSGLSKGIYFLKVKGESRSYLSKIIISE
ncbi:MAG: PKD domain-containing protein [Bacteroidia bacterium]|nr:PKD domain-containing protein [Bacteroidia bacterium]